MERLGVIRHKIWYDLWENRARTARVVAIIAIGAFAVGTVWGAKEFILKDVFLTWQASSPSTVGLIVSPPVDDMMINVMERSREIGVMRAIGASAGVIAGQFIGEGLILG